MSDLPGKPAYAEMYMGYGVRSVNPCCPVCGNHIITSSDIEPCEHTLLIASKFGYDLLVLGSLMDRFNEYIGRYEIDGDYGKRIRKLLTKWGYKANTVVFSYYYEEGLSCSGLDDICEFVVAFCPGELREADEDEEDSTDSVE